jgi:uncharacterized protein YggT (Ycf19 family)
VHTEDELIETGGHPRGFVAGLARIIDFLFGLLYTLLFVRLVLELINASRTAGFFEFILGLTEPFFAPFRGIVGNTALDRSHQIVWPIVIAMAAYAIAHAMIRGLLGLLSFGTNTRRLDSFATTRRRRREVAP